MIQETISLRILEYAYGDYDEIPMPSFQQSRSQEYWAGWALAEYQWYSGESFKDIFSKVSFSQISSMYKVYHEMDVTRFIERMMRYRIELQRETKLKTIRENRGVSQKELSDLSGVKLRSIQMYEQRVNDIDKAQGQTLFKLARVLGCSIEDLLENPSK